MSRWQLDAWVRRSEGGRLLAGGAPARLVRLSATGAAALDRALSEDDAGTAAATAARGDSGSSAARGNAGAGAATGGDAGSAAAGNDAGPAAGTGKVGSAAATEGDVSPATAAETALLERLRDGGLLHPIPGRASTAPLTTVIPVRDGGDSLPALVAAARRWGEVIVVDDRSTDGSATRAAAAGARVVANPGPPGPAAARNAGLRAAATELVAFVDADCEVDRDRGTGAPSHTKGNRPGGAVALCLTPWDKQRPHSPGGPTEDWAPRLAALLEDDPGLALAAPRVRSAPGTGAVAAYEAACSPLDMGASAGLVGPGRRLGYVPSTAFVARRATLLEHGGFDERLRFGEDVDLAWRLAAAGRRVRYAPQAEICHRPRPTAAALAHQRFQYGGSAAALDRLHPGQAAPLRLDHYSAATVAAGAVLGWRAAAVTAALGITHVASRGASARQRPPAALPSGPGKQPPKASPGSRGATGRAAAASQGGARGGTCRALAGVAARGQAQTARQLSRALVRDWLPLTALACLASPRARRLAALAAAVDLAAALRPAAHAAGTSHAALRPAAHAAGTSHAAPLPAARAAGAARAVRAAPGPSPALAALALRPLDHAAYAAGLWAGAVRARSAGALAPIFTGR